MINSNQTIVRVLQRTDETVHRANQTAIRASNKRRVKLVKGERSDKVDAERAYNEQLLPREVRFAV